MIQWELTPIVAVVLIFAAMLVVILIELAKALVIWKEHDRTDGNH